MALTARPIVPCNLTLRLPLGDFEHLKLYQRYLEDLASKRGAPQTFTNEQTIAQILIEHRALAFAAGRAEMTPSDCAEAIFDQRYEVSPHVEFCV